MLTTNNPPTVSGTPNGVMAGMQIVPRNTPNGITAMVRLSSQPYIPTPSGQSGPAVEVGAQRVLTIQDVFAAAAPASGQPNPDPAVATLATAVGTALAAFMASGTQYPAGTPANPAPKALAGALTVIETVMQAFISAANL